eukprot:CAMPEP_0117001868 /NCGR_PEP_ID=MMETSP0472-20121206/3722_1 /TAXON_ID=693140 ORGANISM="Tiarina fusus, Strain LIS" /NCGR_SAMPLE_ID=MMETSP0472 /ASSEMBLY_ACC=CAM_ASM_000603 /LENGTH=153 /DNA_ID=CAMNT_0004702015 /DNA_START=1827 /DNA_END=2285 /DNA_ORIENTATION=+
MNSEKHSNWWGAYVNAFADGGTAFTSDIGSGVALAVNQVSDGQGVTGKVAGVGKGIFSVASGIAIGATKGVSKTIQSARSPSYGSPTKTPPVMTRKAKEISSEDLCVDLKLKADILNSFRRKSENMEAPAVEWGEYSPSLDSSFGAFNIPNYR